MIIDIIKIYDKGSFCNTSAISVVYVYTATYKIHRSRIMKLNFENFCVMINYDIRRGLTQQMS